MIDKSLLLDQERKGIKQLIEENIDGIIIERNQLIDNGFGVLIDDPLGEPQKIKITCRISHKRSIPFPYETIQAGKSSDMERFILTDHETQIFEHDCITEYLGKRWRMGKVDILTAFDGVIGYQAKIFMAENNNGET